jgi:hypothetical protein
MVILNKKAIFAIRKIAILTSHCILRSQSPPSLQSVRVIPALCRVPLGEQPARDRAKQQYGDGRDQDDNGDQNKV